MNEPEIHSPDSVIGSGVTWGQNVSIRGGHVYIGKDSTICDNVRILAPAGFEIGPCSFIGPDSQITCWRFTAGSYLFFEREVEVGRGGCLSSPQSTVTIGNATFCGVGAVINPSAAVTIGSEVGIGPHVGIWTHGAWLPITEGFPAKFAPVKIGNKVLVAMQSQVLAGVEIGNNVVIGVLSFVNKDVPPGSLAGGIPIRVIRENAYPTPSDNLLALLADLMETYRQGAWWKRIDVKLRCEDKGGESFVWVKSRDEERETKFCFSDKTVEGPMTAEAEDFRDFLRRRGIRFLTGKPFCSIPHPEVARYSR